MDEKKDEKFGRYQKLMILVIGTASMLSAMPIFSSVFTAASPDFNCFFRNDSNATKLDDSCDKWADIKLNKNDSIYECRYDTKYYGVIKN
jgi:hypothetical protein